MFSATAMKETASVPRGSLLLILCVLYVCVSVCVYVCVCVFDVGVYSTLRLNAYADRVDLLREGSENPPGMGAGLASSIMQLNMA